VFYMCATTQVERVIVCDTNIGAAQAFVAWFSQLFPAVQFCASADCLKSDIVMCATTSKTPLFDVAHSTAQTIISAGADTEYQRELVFDVDAHEFGIIVDSYDALNYGDCLHYELIEPDVLLYKNIMYRSYYRNVFITTGNALLDNITIRYICETR